MVGARSRYRPAVVITAIVCFLAVSGTVALGVVEIGYRVYLYHVDPAKFRSSPSAPTFMFYRDSVWAYDEEVGYRYKPEHTWFGGFVQNGRFMGCNDSS